MQQIINQINLAPSKPTQKNINFCPQSHFKGGFCFCAWANFHIIPFYANVIETIKSTNAGIRNNFIEVELLIGITFGIIFFVF